MKSIVVRILTQALDLTTEQAHKLTPGVEALIEQEVDRRQRADGAVVVTKNTDGVIVAVTRQDEEGRVLKIISQSELKAKESNNG